jgi:hypothetical protein
MDDFVLPAFSACDHFLLQLCWLILATLLRL